MRYEVKYAVPHLESEAIEAYLMAHPASFTRAYADRQVNNIYLDTPEFKCFHENVEGHPQRKKLRLRWYGSSLLPTVPSVLEEKVKVQELGYKNSYTVEQLVTTPSQLMEAIHSVGIVQAELRPVLYNTYQRSYYLSMDGRFRLTIDRAQTFAMPFTAIPSLSLHLYPVILELKYEAEDSPRASDIMDYLPFRQTKNSKYANGIEELYF